MAQTKAAKKAPTKKALAIKSIIKSDAGECKKIIALHKKHLSKKEIIALGFNKNTVYRQTREADMA